MGAALAVKLFGAPLLIGLASLAGRRWGPALAGLVGGLPVIAGPIVAALWLERGQPFAQAAATALPGGLWAVSAHLCCFGLIGRRAGWAAGLLVGWCAFAACAWGLSLTGLTRDPRSAASGLLALWLASRLLPQPRGPVPVLGLPRFELLARMAAALGLVLGLTALAGRLGPALAGVWAVFPVAGSVLPAFTLARAGSEAMLAQLHGMLAGLSGLGLCFLILSATMEPLGWFAFVPALIGALAMGGGLLWWRQRGARQ
ncbi:hypothetical protein [Chitinimonas lacunae]|uniref:MFS transporter n=1 Tax=Chitinimonas lacunae TaxID=1963018 RepID=A0ABV8MS29_9NEIS